MRTSTRVILGVLGLATGVSGFLSLIAGSKKEVGVATVAAPIVYKPYVANPVLSNSDEGSRVIIEVFGQDWKRVVKTVEDPADRLKYLNAYEKCVHVK